MSTMTHFENEAKDNSEMAYFVLSSPFNPPDVLPQARLLNKVFSAKITFIGFLSGMAPVKTISWKKNLLIIQRNQSKYLSLHEVNEARKSTWKGIKAAHKNERWLFENNFWRKAMKGHHVVSFDLDRYVSLRRWKSADYA